MIPVPGLEARDGLASINGSNLLTGMSALTLVFLAKAHVFNRFRTGLALTVTFSLYACLICYEFVLLIGEI